ncbi:MAG: polyprenyl diphosphate synthase, partial [Acutalibacteraceae bacterium]
MLTVNDINNMPRHIGIIMDGNGRWAKKRMLPRKAGHSQGAKTFQKIARYGNKIGLECMTVYAFSTENWTRPKDEVDALMKIFRDYLKDAKNFKDENIKVRFIGDRSVLDSDIQALMEDSERESADATGMMLNIAINYGGQDEFIAAVNKCIKAGNTEI